IPIVPTTSKDDTGPNDNFDRHIKLMGHSSLADEKTSDGLDIYLYEKNPQKFVMFDDILSKYKKVKFDRTEGFMDCKNVLNLIRTSDKKELIHEIEYININDYKYVTLDYYENTMLPIIKAEEN
ncbi:MAG: hypothetical protein ACYDG2_01225, partial [Ruminiclostridium sp.]